MKHGCTKLSSTSAQVTKKAKDSPSDLSDWRTFVFLAHPHCCLVIPSGIRLDRGRDGRPPLSWVGLCHSGILFFEGSRCIKTWIVWGDEFKPDMVLQGYWPGIRTFLDFWTSRLLVQVGSRQRVEVGRLGLLVQSWRHPRGNGKSWGGRHWEWRGLIVCCIFPTSSWRVFWVFSIVRMEGD